MKKSITQPNSMVNAFYEDTPLLQAAVRKSNSYTIEIEDFSDICMEAIYVIDFKNQCFHSVSDHDLFLCGHSKEEVLQRGYDFYSEIVHRTDLPGWAEMHREILKCLYNPDNMHEINYFSCTFRIKNYRQQTQKQAAYLMVYQKLIPKFVAGEIRYGICLLTCSVIKTTGNLRLYYKNKLHFAAYSFANKKWKTHRVEHLTEREITILRFAKQGMSLKMIASIFCVSYKTLQGIAASIYKKLNVHTIEEAVIYATNHLLVFHPCNCGIHEDKPQCKKNRVKLSPKVLQQIQTDMDSGQSIHSIAKREGVSNGAIHKAIRSGKLNKNR